MAEELINTEKTETKEERAKHRRDRELNDIRKILSLPEGRRFYWRLLATCDTFNETFAGAGMNDLSNYNQGKRRVGRWAFAELLSASPATFQQMQRENDSEFQSAKNEEEREEKKKDILNTNV